MCVCNSTYCDTIAPIKKLPEGEYNLYTTSKSGDRFKKTVGYFESLNAKPYGNNLNNKIKKLKS